MKEDFKFANTMSNLKPEAEWHFSGDYPMTEEKYATMEWATGVNENETAILTTVNPHSELTWAKVNAELTRLQTEYDAQEYARNRQEEYPSIEECVHAILDDDLDNLQVLRQAVKDKFPKT